MVEVTPSLTQTLNQKLAELARLELSVEELSAFTAQLDQVLKFVGTIQEVNVAGIEPMIHPHDFALPLREDRIQELALQSDGSSPLLENAPEIQDNGYKVPSIL